MLTMLMAVLVSQQINRDAARVPRPQIRVRHPGDADFITVESPPEPVKGDDDEDAAPVAPAPPVRRFDARTAVLGRENFDRWLFRGSPDHADQLANLHAILSVEIAKAEVRHRLTREQSAKLRLAGRGDIRRFFDRVDSQRREFEVAREHVATGREALGDSPR